MKKYTKNLAEMPKLITNKFTIKRHKIEYLRKNYLKNIFSNFI